jgi:hypothetical protein
MKRAQVVNLLIMIAAALVSSAIIKMLTPGASWLAFFGWTVFFVSIQIPFIFTRMSYTDCLSWFTRSRGGNAAG